MAQTPQNGRELQRVEQKGLENLDVIKKLEANFSPEEVLIGKFILSLKGLSGLTHRLKGHSYSTNAGPVKFYVLNEEVPQSFFDKMGFAAGNYFKIEGFQESLIIQAAKKLGISPKRYGQIKDFVYENETEM